MSPFAAIAMCVAGFISVTGSISVAGSISVFAALAALARSLASLALPGLASEILELGHAHDGRGRRGKGRGGRL